MLQKNVFELPVQYCRPIPNGKPTQSYADYQSYKEL